MQKTIVTITLGIILVVTLIPVWPQANGKAVSILERLLKLESELVPPVGSVLPFMGTTAPKGWLLADGSSYSVTRYPQLAAVLGRKYREGQNFRVPDLRGKVPVGAGHDRRSGLSNRILGNVCGCETQSSNVEVSRQPAFNVPAHYHGKGNLCVNGGSHTHNMTHPQPFQRANSGVYGYWNGQGAPQRAIFYDGAFNTPLPITHTHPSTEFSGNVGNLGGPNGDAVFPAVRTVDVVVTNKAVNNMQPSLVVHFIIKY